MILEHFGKVYPSFIINHKNSILFFFNLHHSVLFPVALMEPHTHMYDCLFVCMNVYVLNVICKSSNHFFFIGLGSVPFKKFDVVSFRQLFVILWITTKVVNWEFGIVRGHCYH